MIYNTENNTDDIPLAYSYMDEDDIPLYYLVNKDRLPFFYTMNTEKSKKQIRQLIDGSIITMVNLDKKTSRQINKEITVLNLQKKTIKLKKQKRRNQVVIDAKLY